MKCSVVPVPKNVPTHPIDREYIREWLVVGPFFSDDLEKDFLADVGGEANIHPQEGDTVTTADGTSLTWKRYTAKGNIVDLLDAIGNYEYTTAYAFCVLQCDAAGTAEIRLGSDDGVAVWINEKRVHNNPVGRPLTLDEDVFEVDFKAGSNDCMVKVSQLTLDWLFAMRMTMLSSNRAVLSGVIADEAGQPIPNASVRLEHDGKEIAQTTTDTTGSYRLNISPMPGGYDLSATDGEKGEWRLDIPLREGEHQILNLTLKKAISIEGTLFMFDDTTPHVAVPVQAVKISKSANESIDDSCPQAAIGDSQLEVVVTTLSDEGGKYRFINLKPGQYQIRCQVLGGYVYYGSDNPSLLRREYGGDVISVTRGKPLKNIDFRFAPFKKGAWQNYAYLLNGLAHNEVFAIHRDSDGVIWFGTRGGVSRYDGKEFKNFTTEDGLVNNHICAIHRDSNGVMWFGTADGVSRYDGKEFVNFTIKDNNFVWAIHQDPGGVMWFGTEKGGVFRYDGKEFVNFTIKDGLADKTVRAIHRDSDGVMWFGTWVGGVSRYDGKKFVSFTTKDGLANNHVFAIHRAPDGVMWFGTWGGGVSRYDGKEFVNFTTEDGLVNNHVCAIHRDSDGVIWFGTARGVSRYDGKGFINFTIKDGLAHNRVTAIHQDGIMWIGTAGGVSRYDGKGFVNFTIKDGLPENIVRTIYQDPDGVIWFGIRGGVSRYDRKEFKNFTTENGLAHYDVWAIHRDPDGVMWFGTYGGGVSRYDGKEFVNFTPKDGLAHNEVTGIHQDPDGVMWFATRGDVSRYDGKQFVKFTTKDGLMPHGDVRAMYQDSERAMWFGTIIGVFRYDGNQLVNFSIKDGLAENTVRAIYQDSKRVMWFGTAGGVSQYDGKRFVNFTTKDGLAENIVRAIYQDSNGAMWFGTHGGGVSCYDGVSWMSLDTRDGLAGNSVGSIHQDSEGFLWFGTDEGVTRYRRSTATSKVLIVSVQTDKEYLDLQAIPSITTSQRVTIKYNAIDFKTLPEKRQYRYRIKSLAKRDTELSGEIDADWCRPTKETNFDWTPKEPGTYTFEVRAIDRDLNYSEPATVRVTVQLDARDIKLAALNTEVDYLRREAGRKYQFENIIGRSAAIKQVRALMEKAIDSGLSVLVTGETGTGKEPVAKAIHYNSPRKDKPLLDLNCGAVPKELIASELFGYCKGAFTGATEDKMGLFEAASGGTVLLDEIGEMPEEAQVHLLRLLQERKVRRLGEHKSRDIDVRVIAITNKALAAEVSAGRFREDLFYRLNVFCIHVPPLRERIDDIPLLAEHFLKQASRQQGKEVDGFAPEVLDLLSSYAWPGNIRKLENEIHRAVALAEEGMRLETYHFSPELTHGESLMQEVISEGSGLRAAMKQFQRRYVEQVLRECSGNRSEAARRLNMDRPYLIKLIKQLGIEE